MNKKNNNMSKKIQSMTHAPMSFRSQAMNRGSTPVNSFVPKLTGTQTTICVRSSASKS
jgi:hypothetical protein